MFRDILWLWVLPSVSGKPVHNSQVKSAVCLEDEFSFVQHEDKAHYNDAKYSYRESQEVVQCRYAIRLADDHQLEVLAEENAIVEYVVQWSSIDSQSHLLPELGATLVVTSVLEIVVNRTRSHQAQKLF